MSELWNGFAIEKFEFEGKDAFVVFPKEGTANGKLALKTEYWEAFPEAVELPLLRKGFHLCFIRNDNRWASEDQLDRKARFVKFVAEKYGLSEKTVPVGMSCGGLIAVKFAAKYPELVSCLYLDAPVMNYMSCPCGFGSGDPLVGEGYDGIREVLDALHMSSISELICYREMPMDKIPVLLENKIPVAMVAGGSDPVVPYHENGINLQRAYEKSDIPFVLYIKPECAHHPHGLEDPTKVVEFILKNV
jgi:pimeloyl-ACP methyl ester carboxylesterase